MRIVRKYSAALVIAAAASLALAGCGTSNPQTPASTPATTAPSSAAPTTTAPAKPVTIKWWTNVTADPGKTFWQTVAKEYSDAHPGVTVEFSGYQNEELQRTLIPQALQAGGDAAPDIFMVWPGGEVASQVKAGYLMDLTQPLADTIKDWGGVLAPWQVDGKQYGVPFTFSVEGFFYNKDLFAQAGITAPPKTLPELNDAVTKLKAINVAPIAVGAGDLWPAGHWWYQFALASCSVETLQKATSTYDFTDPCWVKAGEQLKAFVDTNPFQDGWQASSGQQGADSSAGWVANGKAAMELMGGWNEGTIGSLAPDTTGDGKGDVPAWLGWFPMVSIPGSAGLAGIQMGGGDGWGIYKDAPPETVDFLKFISSPEIQKRFTTEGQIGNPANPGAFSAVTDPVLLQIMGGMQAAPYIQLWLDSALGPNFGGPMNQAIVDLMSGKGTPQDVVKAIQDTAAKQ